MIAVDWAKDRGKVGNMSIIKGEAKPWGWSIADHMVFSKVCNQV